jgi:glycolate oxidase FAD binding subunit
MARLDRVLDYPARDMTVTVQAGITLARLLELLAAENQRLPIDVPQPERATLGGALATNTSGPRRYGFGTLRDYVIGISAVNDEGHEVKAGGRVVKNVAGYDLCKLFIGSLGTLGILTQVTLKLKPRPDEQALLAFACEPGEVESRLDLLHRTRTRPVCVELLNPAAVSVLRHDAPGLLPEAPWVVVAGFEDNCEAVAWQVQLLIRELYAAGSRQIDARAGAAAGPLWRALAEFPARGDGPLTLKANLLPHATAAFCLEASRAGLALQAHAGNGIVVGHAPPGLTLEAAQAMLSTLHPHAAAARGNVILPRCPTAWKRTLPVWGVPRGDAWLMRTVKEKMDPRRLFNPGRFADGL